MENVIEKWERKTECFTYLYAYCANNPVNYVDPSGHMVIAIPIFYGAGAIILKIAAVAAAGAIVGTLAAKATIARLKSGKSIYTYYASNAKKAVKKTGWGCTKREIHLKAGRASYYHYHTKKHKSEHAGYGTPLTIQRR